MDIWKALAEPGQHGKGEDNVTEAVGADEKDAFIPLRGINGMRMRQAEAPCV